MPLCVRGDSIRSKLLFARQAFGPKAEQDLQAFLADQGVSQILDDAWYPFEAYDQLLRRLADRHFEGDLSRLVEVGEYSAESTLKTTYQVYNIREFMNFLKRLSSLHGHFYNSGRLENELDSRGLNCHIRMLEAPYYSDPDLYVASGFYQGAARFMGLQGVECEFRRIGDSEVHFNLTWVIKGDEDQHAESD